MTVTDAAAIPVQRDAPETDSWAIVQRAQAGDPEAFAELYELYRDRVFRFIYFRMGNRPLAEDLTGDTFVRALKYIAAWKFQGPEFGAVLMTIARNLTFDYYKSSRYRLEILTGELLRSDEPERGPEGDPEATTVGRSRDRVLHAAVKQLNEVQREVIVLRFFRGLSVSDTAEAMGKEVGAIKALQYRATGALRRLLPDLEALR